MSRNLVQLESMRSGWRSPDVYVARRLTGEKMEKARRYPKRLTRTWASERSIAEELLAEIATKRRLNIGIPAISVGYRNIGIDAQEVVMAGFPLWIGGVEGHGWSARRRSFRVMPRILIHDCGVLIKGRMKRQELSEEDIVLLIHRGLNRKLQLSIFASQPSRPIRCERREDVQSKLSGERSSNQG